MREYEDFRCAVLIGPYDEDQDQPGDRVTCQSSGSPLEITQGSSKAKSSILPLCWHHQQLAESALLSDFLRQEKERGSALRLAAREDPKATPDSDSVVYFLQRSDGVVKIGYSANLTLRKKTLETATGPLRLLAIIPGARDLESELHERFKKHRLYGEWFSPDASLLSFANQYNGVVRSQRGWERFFHPPLESAT